MTAARIHATAIVEIGAEIGEDSQIWHFAHIRTGAKIGRNCVFGKGVYIDQGVQIGDSVKIQNNVSVFSGVEIEAGVFVGPHVCFTNDKIPRAVSPEMQPKKITDWTEGKILVKKGASIGANATIITGVTLGEWCMIGAGSVVTRDVPPFALVVGNPARIVGYVDETGKRINAAPKR